MPPAELELTGEATSVPVKGYVGKNLTLPASWWTSSSLFQLERRAIFAKVFYSLNLIDADMVICYSRLARREAWVISHP
jgi:hypothetical protein